MTLEFPKNPTILENNKVQGETIAREWSYNHSKERWELSGFDSLAFRAESPITQNVDDGDIITDFDIQDLESV